MRTNRLNRNGSVHGVEGKPAAAAVQQELQDRTHATKGRAAPTSTQTTTTTPPPTLLAPIEGSAGSRVRVILGGRGTDFLLLLDEEDGTTTWQSKHWSATLPPGLE